MLTLSMHSPCREMKGEELHIIRRIMFGVRVNVSEVEVGIKKKRYVVEL